MFKRLVPISMLFLLALVSNAAMGSNQPTSATYHDPKTKETCPITGASDSTDPELNTLKNRISLPTQYAQVKVSQFSSWPTHSKKKRSLWSAQDRQAFSKHENAPAFIIGYLIGIRAETQAPGEATNCHATATPDVDFHSWIVDQPVRDKKTAAVAEFTPRWRQANPAWTYAALSSLAARCSRVRISGWPLFDQDHPEQLGKSRVSLWEIHPITKIEVATSANSWAELGDSPAKTFLHNRQSNRC